jgi:hypothetical protein
MKRIIASIGLAILCCAISTAQNINQETFNKLVDYVNCKYVQTYLEQEAAKRPTEPDVKLYKEKIKEKLDKCTPDESLSFDQLSKLLKDNHWGETEERLAQVINRKKGTLGNIDDRILEKLVSVEDLSGVLQKNLMNRKDELYNELKNRDSKTVEAKVPNVDPKRRNRDNYTNFWLWGIIILEGLSLAVLSVLFWRRSSDERIENRISESRYLRKKWRDNLTNINDCQNNINTLGNKLYNLERNLNILRSELNNNKEKINIGQNPIQSEQKPQPQRYLKRRSDKVFNQVSDDPDGSFFRLFDQQGNRAKFDFCGNEAEAIANRDAVFDMICETFGVYHSAQHIVTEVPGEVELQNNKWVVIRNAGIKFV